MNEFSEKIIDLSKKALKISWDNTNLCREVYNKSNQLCIIHINNEREYINYSFNISDIEVGFEIFGKIKDKEVSEDVLIHIFLKEKQDNPFAVFIIPKDEDNIPEQYRSEILEKMSVDFSKYFKINNNDFFDCLPEDIQTLLEEVNMTDNTAMLELLRWHRSLKYLSAMYFSLQDSKLSLENGSYFLIKRRLKNIITIWNIYYDILDEQSLDKVNLRQELYKLKQELSNLNIEFLI